MMTTSVSTAAHPENCLVQGKVVALRSSVVDVWFPRDIPELNTQLEVPQEPPIIIEVITQVDAHTVRGIALTPTSGLARGTAVVNTGHPIQVPVGDRLLGRVFDVFGHAIDGKAR
jgi:F-type H+-transporting ATPase subunit beta